MEEFAKKLADILEVEQVQASDELKAFPTWDSLAVLSIVAMLDSDYGVNLRANDFERLTSVANLWSEVQTRRKT